MRETSQFSLLTDRSVVVLFHSVWSCFGSFTLGVHQPPNERRQQFRVHILVVGKQQTNSQSNRNSDDGANSVVVLVRDGVYLPHVRTHVQVLVHAMQPTSRPN